MEQSELLNNFVVFGMTGLLGFLIGLERSMGGPENPHATVRDFVIFALAGALSGYAASLYDNSWLIFAAFLGVLSLLVSGYWAELRQNKQSDTGITTEAAVVVTFFLGVLIVRGAQELAIAVAIVLMIVLSKKRLIDRFGKRIQTFEVQATLKFLVITFIVLPILPHQSLDTYTTYSIGAVSATDQPGPVIEFVPDKTQIFDEGQSLELYVEGTGRIGDMRIVEFDEDGVSGDFIGDEKILATISPGTELQASLVPRFINVMLSAIKPFQVWLIVVLVSFIGFVGYVLIKVVGAGAGIGLTGLVGGLASSTVTTLSFAGRSKEMPQLNRLFAVAVILASSVMFPRVVFQIGVFNQQLMANIAQPMLVTGATGLLLAGLLYYRTRDTTGNAEEISFDNPFSLKSAVTFGLIFATILIVTRVATTYLGDAWLPVVALISGLTDADAIAFSVSDLQRAGLISLDWASFNLVLGALSNTMMKLFLVFSLGDRGLFRHCLVAFLIMGVAGIATMLITYDIKELMF